MTGRKRYKVISNEIQPKNGSGQTMIYQIRIKGHLGDQWAEWFDGQTITLEDNGDTLLNRPGELTKPRCMDCSKKCVTWNAIGLSQSSRYQERRQF